MSIDLIIRSSIDKIRILLVEKEESITKYKELLSELETYSRKNTVERTEKGTQGYNLVSVSNSLDELVELLANDLWLSAIGYSLFTERIRKKERKY